jgi:hypothetical protein
MGDVHQLILRHGVIGAKALAATKTERHAVEAAAAVLGEEIVRLGIIHAGFAMTSLPHKRIEDRVWKREGLRTTLYVESGIARGGAPIGVPYGSIARLILLYLQTEAIRTGSPEVELGRSMNTWLGRMGLAVGGRTYQLVAEQARRISACRMTFFTDLDSGAEARSNGAFVRGSISMTGVRDDGQPSLWQDRVRLDEDFWKSLRDHPVPVREEAIKAIGTRSVAIDIYIWLAYRLHSLTRKTPLTWAAVHAQFGTGVRQIRHMRPVFTEGMSLALAVYPEARVDVNEEGIVLHPSPPAVPRADMKRLGLA